MALHAGTANLDAWRLFDDSVKQQVDPVPPSPTHSTGALPRFPLQWTSRNGSPFVTSLCLIQVTRDAQPLSEAASMLATLCGAGHARLATQQLMDLLREALYTVHMPRFWSHLAPFAAPLPADDLLETLPAAIQVCLVSP